ncbi:hypothetical protein BW97_08440 [Escherichia coli O69:H11 str. 07-4281]|nr:hypothetical protein BW97_08440 [Escherichia coli O69:H11 str. 07-4281]
MAITGGSLPSSNSTTKVNFPIVTTSDKLNTNPVLPPSQFLPLRMPQARSLIHLLLNIFKVIFRIQYCSSCCPQPCFGVLFFTLEAGNRFSELIASVMKLSNLSHHSLTIVRTPQNILKRVHNTSALQAQDNAILFMNLNGPMLTALLCVVFSASYCNVQQLLFIALWLHQCDDIIAFIFHQFTSWGGSGSSIQYKAFPNHDKVPSLNSTYSSCTCPAIYSPCFE